MTFPSCEQIAPELLQQVRAYLKCRAGEVAPSLEMTHAWDQFFRAFSSLIRRSIAPWELGEQDREDCTQEIWKEVLLHLQGFGDSEIPRRPRNWLSVVARNKAVDVIRRKCRRPMASLSTEVLAGLRDGRAEDPATLLEREVLCTAVRAVVARLPDVVSESSFRVFLLRWDEGRSMAEIAAALGMTPAQARFRYHRVTRTLRRLLECSLHRLPVRLGRLEAVVSGDL
ncbi:RNA polymerase sigma factor [Singulisphaera acidiphila]|nr:sigma-70 family RNA polymerase sigma factor [Singulisphaera acidiphila]